MAQSLSFQNSTNVRTPAPTTLAVPWALRATFRVLSAVAPGLAATWADRVFCTPPRHPVPADEAAVLDRAATAVIRVDGRDIRTWTWSAAPGAPTVLLVHGWGGRGGQLATFVPALLARGYTVITFDGPGHGRSDRGLSSLVEHARAVRGVATLLSDRNLGAPQVPPSGAAAETERPGLHAVIAHSMGGAATAIALESGMSVRRVVLVAPPFAATDWVEPFSAALGLTANVRDRMIRRVEARIGVAMDTLTMARTAPLMSAPSLVIHDRADKEVPFSAGAGIAARWPGARLHATEGLGHKRILADASVIALAVDFVAEA